MTKPVALVATLAVLGAAHGCGGAEPPPLDAAAVSTARSFAAHVLREDFDAAFALLAPDAAVPARGSEFWAGSEGLVDVRYRFGKTVVDDDRVDVRYCKEAEIAAPATFRFGVDRGTFRVWMTHVDGRWAVHRFDIAPAAVEASDIRERIWSCARWSRWLRDA